MDQVIINDNKLAIKIQDLREGHQLMIDDHICKILNISLSNTPKKWLRKFLFIGIDIIT